MRSYILSLFAVFCFAGVGHAVEQGAKDLKIDGIEDYQVFVRDGMVGSIAFSVVSNGTLKAEVLDTKKGKAVAKQKWDVSGASANSPVELAIKKVPVGGEYTVKFTQNSKTATFEHILVGEIWVLGGQSNAVGVVHEPEPASPYVHFYKGGSGWREGHGLLFPILWTMPEGKVYVSAWRRAGETYHKKTGIPVGLMGWAFGGVSMKRFWTDDLKEMPDFKDLVSKHGRGATMYMYYQGESDCNRGDIAVYEDRLHRMAEAIRRYSGNPDLAMLVCQLSWTDLERKVPSPEVGRLCETQRQFCLKDPRAVLIPAIPYTHSDNVHLDFDGFMALGDRIADCVADITKTGKVTWQGPRPIHARYTDDSRRSIKIPFDSTKRVKVLQSPLSPADRANTHKPEMDWFVMDSNHLGYPEALGARVENGELVVRLEGGAADFSDAKADAGRASIRLKKTGYMHPTKVSAKGKVVTLELPEPGERGAKVSYGLMNDSLCTLVGADGLAASTFDGIVVEEPEK